MKTTTIALSLCLVLICSGCNKKKDNSNATTFKPESTVSEGELTTKKETKAHSLKEDEAIKKAQTKKLATVTDAEARIDETTKAAPSQDKVILSATEKVSFPGYNITLKGRIDTGAKTTSIDARNLVVMERDGKKWVRFELDGNEIELPVSRTVKIKRHNAESTKRYVVKLNMEIQSIKQVAEVTLTDRSKFEYPVLVGRNFLNDLAIVDVSATNPLTKQNN